MYLTLFTYQIILNCFFTCSELIYRNYGLNETLSCPKGSLDALDYMKRYYKTKMISENYITRDMRVQKDT